MNFNAHYAYGHTGTYYYGLKSGAKYDDGWKYPKNKICIVSSKNSYSALFLFIGV